tara:strand:- start:342 stop:608 length:267 start_codon:yes stop_codon:yes gene_type:complete
MHVVVGTDERVTLCASIVAAVKEDGSFLFLEAVNDQALIALNQSAGDAHNASQEAYEAWRVLLGGKDDEATHGLVTYRCRDGTVVLVD